MEEKATIVYLHEYDEDEISRYDVPSNFFKVHISWTTSELPSTSCHGNDFAIDSKASRYVENKICVVDPCHNQDYLRFHPLEGETLVDHILFSGSLKEDKEKSMASMKKFVDTNALVERCRWKYYEGELKGESFL